MLRTKTVNAGLNWQVPKTIRLYEFILEEGASVSAPDGKFVALTVNGIGKELKAPCHYQGDIVLTVADCYPMAPHGLMRVNQISRAFEDAVVITDGKVDEAKCVPAVVQGGCVTGEKTEGVYIASEAESFNAILVTGDSAYEVKDSQIDLEGFGANDFMGVGAAVAAIDRAKVTVSNCDINVNGVTRCAIHAGGDSVVTVNDSRINGNSPDSDWLGSFSWAVGFKGTNRLNQLTDNAKVFYNRCQCRSNGWGVLSIDGSDDGVEMVVTDSELELYGPRSEGYGAFCIGENHVRFDHTKVKVNGYPLLLMGMEGLGRAEVVNGSELTGRRFGVLVINDDNSVLELRDSAIRTWKSALCIKGSATKIILDHMVMEPGNGVLVQLMDDDQTGMPFADFKIPVGVKDEPVEGRDLCHASETEDVVMELSNSVLQGNIYNSTTNIRATRYSTMGDMGRFHDALVGILPMFDPDQPPMPSPVEQRHNGDDLMGPKNLGLTFRNVQMTGVISSATQAYREGLNLITEKNREELSNVTQTAAPTVNNGVVLSLDQDSVWTVTGTSYLTALTLAEGAKVTGVDGRPLTMLVDGAETPIAPGTYTGKIALLLG